jgi:hypothetical protein
MLLIAFFLSTSNFREKAEENQRIRDEIAECDSHLNNLKGELALYQQDITNAKISQSMRLSQISRLSGLAQPIELDHTFFFVDRFPQSSIQRDSSSNSRENLQTLGIVKTGESVLLEARLNEINKQIEGNIFAFSSAISSINLNPNFNFLHSPQSVALKKEASGLVGEHDRCEQRYIPLLHCISHRISLLLTVLEILSLRLDMIHHQRESIEEDHLLKGTQLTHDREEKEMKERLQSAMKKMKDKYQLECKLTEEKYEKETELLVKKIENRRASGARHKKREQEKEAKLKEDLVQAKEK